MGAGQSALHSAVESGELSRVRVAIQERPSDIDAQEPNNGWTPLHVACGRGYEHIVRELLARGAAPNLIDRNGRTPLHLAAAAGQQQVCRDLLRKGADPLRLDKDGKAPLDVALERQQSGTASLLSEALAGRGIAATPTGSPTVAQGQARAAAAQQQLAAAYGAAGQPALPDLGGLQLDGRAGSGARAGGAAYPSVPPALPGSGGDVSWLSQLPLPPGVSLALPSAPPASGIYAAPQQQQQQQAAAAGLDYLDYIVVPQAPQVPPAAAGAAYPQVPSPAPTAPGYGLPDPPQAQQQQQQWQQQQWPAGAGPQPQQQQQPQQQPQPQRAAPSAAASADDDDAGWGAAVDDDWGGEADTDSRPPAPAGPGPGSAAGMSRQEQQQPNLVGAAVSGAGKVAGAVGSIAVAGARQLLTGLIPRPPGQGGGRGSPGPDGAPALSGPSGRLYSYAELASATQGFSNANKLGAGGFGPVYRGMLDGLPVAVKLLDPSGCSSQGPKEFQAEVAILSRLHHPHIVLLIGSCPERCALVYELLEYGSLEQHLFSTSKPDLAWQDRVRIACEVASALAFLHSAPEPIIHMDLKPGNLLLNSSLACKVGDVGLSRLMPAPAARALSSAGGPDGSGAPSTVLDSRIVGTINYLDPEYLRTGRFGPKSDIYSLGVILLQMLTGQDSAKVVATVEAALARAQGDAASFARIIDARAGPWPVPEAASFAHLAMRCVSLQRAARPELRGEVLPALLQLVERARLYGDGGRHSFSARRCLSIGSSSPPSMMVCPITQDVMEDPVFAADGYTYEREAIAGWISSHAASPTSPMTNLPLAHTSLTPNHALRSAICEWQDKQQQRR